MIWYDHVFGVSAVYCDTPAQWLNTIADSQCLADRFQRNLPAQLRSGILLQDCYLAMASHLVEKKGYSRDLLSFDKDFL